MARPQLLMRADGQLVRTYRVGCSLTEEEAAALVNHSEKIYGKRVPINDILSDRLWAGINAWTMSPEWEGD